MNILKVDIEHAELELFRNGAPWMKSVDNLAIELHDIECTNVSKYECQSIVEGEVTYCFNIKQKAAASA